jgi:hypothetical protein
MSAFPARKARRQRRDPGKGVVLPADDPCLPYHYVRASWTGRDLGGTSLTITCT